MDVYAIEGFCQRWLEKASRYQDDTLEDLFDKFFTLFVAYNRLYTVGAEIVRGRVRTPAPIPLRGDRNEATTAMSMFIGQTRFSKFSADNPLTSEACIAIANLLQHRQFFLHAKRDSKEPDWNGDARLLEGLATIHLKSVLDCIYQIRCNMFHGEKEFAPRQKELLLPAIYLLETVVQLSREALQEHNANRRLL